MTKQNNNRQVQLGYLKVILATSTWGTFGLFVRSLDYSPEFILFCRFSFGFLGLLIYVSARKNLSWRATAYKHWKSIVGPAVLTGLSWLAYTYSLSYTSVSNAVFLVYTAPVFVVAFSPLILKEKLELRTILALLLSLLGTTAIMGYSSLSGTSSSLLGNTFALIGGITYGIFVLYLKKVPVALLGLPSNLLMSGIISLLLLPFGIASTSLLNWNSFLTLLALGLLHQTIATTLYHSGIRSIKAQHAGILSYIEPLAATVLAALFLYEGLTLGSLLGGTLIVCGGAIVVLRPGSKNAQTLPTAPTNDKS